MSLKITGTKSIPCKAIVLMEGEKKLATIFLDSNNKELIKPKLHRLLSEEEYADFKKNKSNFISEYINNNAVSGLL